MCLLAVMPVSLLVFFRGNQAHTSKARPSSPLECRVRKCAARPTRKSQYNILKLGVSQKRKELSNRLHSLPWLELRFEAALWPIFASSRRCP